MPKLNANNITIEYDTFGDRKDKPLLLVMGLGAQMIAWDEMFCEQLAEAGHYVIRYDNRDVGLTTRFHDHGEADLEDLVMKLLTESPVEVAYTLEDMALDGMSFLTELGIEKAHICGASLGGMIVQTMAIEHPERVLSMTSIMSTTGNPLLPPATPEAMEALTSERVDDPEHAMNRAVEVNKVIGSPGFPRDEERLRQKGLESYERAYYPPGVSRQMAAVITNGDRSEKLNGLNLPTLVIHGAEDPLIPVTGGIDTHENIPGSELMVIDGMGHDLPMGAWDQIVSGITTVTEDGVYARLTEPEGA